MHMQILRLMKALWNGLENGACCQAKAGLVQTTPRLQSRGVKVLPKPRDSYSPVQKSKKFSSLVGILASPLPGRGVHIKMPTNAYKNQ